MLTTMDNKDYVADASKAAEKAGNFKSLGDAVGLPDAEDKAIIQKYLLSYEREHPGEIQFHRDAARARLVEAGKDIKFAVMDKNSRRRYMLELPVEIGQWLERVYPLMFTEKTHTQWLYKNFPELLIPERY